MAETHSRDTTAPCKTCTRPTAMLLTHLCDRCWQLQRVLEGARVMLQDLRSRDAVRKLLLDALEAYVPTGDEPVTVGDVVQLDATTNAAFAGCFVVVEEVKPWGIKGVTPVPGSPVPGIAPIRVENGAFRRIGRAG